jgi:hypothetical protein
MPRAQLWLRAAAVMPKPQGWGYPASRLASLYGFCHTKAHFLFGVNYATGRSNII